MPEPHILRDWNSTSRHSVFKAIDMAWTCPCISGVTREKSRITMPSSSFFDLLKSDRSVYIIFKLNSPTSSMLKENSTEEHHKIQIHIHPRDLKIDTKNDEPRKIYLFSNMASFILGPTYSSNFSGGISMNTWQHWNFVFNFRRLSWSMAHSWKGGGLPKTHSFPLWSS